MGLCHSLGTLMSSYAHQMGPGKRRAFYQSMLFLGASFTLRSSFVCSCLFCCCPLSAVIIESFFPLCPGCAFQPGVRPIQHEGAENHIVHRCGWDWDSPGLTWGSGTTSWRRHPHGPRGGARIGWVKRTPYLHSRPRQAACAPSLDGSVTLW